MYKWKIWLSTNYTNIDVGKDIGTSIGAAENVGKELLIWWEKRLTTLFSLFSIAFQLS